MTTTGGPDQSFADPASRDQSADDPVVIRRDPVRLDGDDITIVPDAGRRDPARRVLVVAVVVVLAVAAGIGVALANRHGSATKTGTSKLRSIAPVRPPAAHPTPAPKSVAGKPEPVTPAQPKKLSTPPVNIATPASVLGPPVASPPAVTPPPAQTPPPVTATTPAVAPTSVLKWQSTPAALSIKAGASATFTVTVINPTSATVTLPLPLSCDPVLRRENGAVVGGSVCEQITELMVPHSRLTQRYTAYATKTADPSGDPLAPGNYTARVESLYAVKVTVTAS